jgi:heme/copper-type cytochrome/quinol oxidase subunit 1
MVFLFIMPGLISALGNYVVPHTYSGIDFATPRLNNLAFWLSVLAIQILIVAISFKDGLAAGWTLYYPLTGIDYSSSASVSLAVVFLHVLGLSSEFGAITFLVSLHLARNAGINVLNFCLISWSIAVVSILLITTLPILGAGITLIFAERQGNVATLLGNFVDGADPVAFQHLFWFFGHPEVYVIILPAFGIISEKIRELADQKSISHPGMSLAIWSIGLVSYFVWAHHMFTVGMADLSRIYFSAATAIIGIPTAIKIFSWSLGLSEIKLRNFEYLVVSGFIVCFVFGGFTGLLLANQAIDLAYHDTYFVVGHFHFVLSIAAAIAAVLFALNFLSAINSVSSSSITLGTLVGTGLIAVNVLFIIQHLIGIEGHPRRVFLSPEIFVAFHNFANMALPMLVVTLQLFSYVKFSSQRSSPRLVPFSVNGLKSLCG